jgi:meso-butanediol dehydrogenase / (S,S)-butanediol dehydrogenase / diacetyl reductase
MSTRFAGKVVIVTGSGTGIGAATAKRFHAEGAIVVLNGRRESKLLEVAAALGSERFMVRPADVSIADDVEDLVADVIRRFDRIDVLVNNAGTGAVGDFATMPIELWQSIRAVNLDGLINMSRAALPHLVKSQGSIINNSSLSGLGGDRGLAFYNATKGAVSNLTRSLAMEFGARGVRINAVCPSLTFTDLVAPAFEQNPEALERAFPWAAAPSPRKSRA